MNGFLLVDVGNTSTKWAVSDENRIRMEFELPTYCFAKGRRKSPGLPLPKVKGAVISCVVPQALPSIRACLRNLGIRNPLVVTAKTDLGIGIRYPQPARIGADRLVNSVAAAALYGVPSIVVDFGTAVTFDVISKRKEYLGGVIAPGLRSMTDYLHDHTALLPRISLAEPKSAIGKNTIAAMRVGAVVGYRGLVREILKEIMEEMKTPPSKVHVIATGGHSSLVASKVPEIQHVDSRLTLHGLRLVYCRNFL